MIIKQRSYTPAPEGVHAAVCVDVADLGTEETPWGEAHKCRIVWEISAKMEDGRPFTINKKYTVSLHEKSNLFKDLKAWRGRAFTAAELDGFDLEKVLGAPCQLVVTHDEKDGKVYGNISAILKADPKNRLTPSGKYKRWQDREENKAKLASAKPEAAEQHEDDTFASEADDNISF